ncbi:hypothetical protein ABPG74_021932 [Tetrahymena malaccensis]
MNSFLTNKSYELEEHFLDEESDKYQYASLDQLDFFGVDPLLKIEIKEEQMDYSVDQNLNRECEICYEEMTSQNFKQLQCQDVFHKSCLEQYFKTQINMKKFPLNCPNSKCQQSIQYHDIKEILSDQDFQKYEMFQIQNYIDSHQEEYQWCLTPGCSNAFIKDQYSKNYRCGACLISYCLNCKQKYHFGQTCQEYQQSIKFTEQDKQFDDLAKSQNFKQCSKCKIWVEKKLGCNNVTCRCGYTFCYKCGENYKGCKCQNMPQNAFNQFAQTRTQNAVNQNQQSNSSIQIANLHNSNIGIPQVQNNSNNTYNYPQQIQYQSQTQNNSRSANQIQSNQILASHANNKTETINYNEMRSANQTNSNHQLQTQNQQSQNQNNSNTQQIQQNQLKLNQIPSSSSVNQNQISNNLQRRPNTNCQCQSCQQRIKTLNSQQVLQNGITQNNQKASIYSSSTQYSLQIQGNRTVQNNSVQSNKEIQNLGSAQQNIKNAQQYQNQIASAQSNPSYQSQNSHQPLNYNNQSLVYPQNQNLNVSNDDNHTKHQEQIGNNYIGLNDKQKLNDTNQIPISNLSVNMNQFQQNSIQYEETKSKIQKPIQQQISKTLKGQKSSQKVTKKNQIKKQSQLQKLKDYFNYIKKKMTTLKKKNQDKNIDSDISIIDFSKFESNMDQEYSFSQDTEKSSSPNYYQYSSDNLVSNFVEDQSQTI